MNTDWEKELSKILYESIGILKTDSPTIDRTREHELSVDVANIKSFITSLLASQRAHWLRSEIEKLENEMKEEQTYGDYPPSEAGWNSGFDYGNNQALTSIITRYKEELLELDKTSGF